MCVLVSLLVSFSQVFPTKFCIHFSSPPCYVSRNGLLASVYVFFFFSGARDIQLNYLRKIQDSLVSIQTRLRIGNWGSIPGRSNDGIFLFSPPPQDPLLVPPNLLSNGYRRLFTRV
jgi:hypothetical protein